jgi:hypothetical protein
VSGWPPGSSAGMHYFKTSVNSDLSTRRHIPEDIAVLQYQLGTAGTAVLAYPESEQDVREVRTHW